MDRKRAQKEARVEGTSNLFMEMVQLHERTWGQDSYPNRPTLHQLLSAKFVVVWAQAIAPPDIRRTSTSMSANTPARSLLTCHELLDEIHDLLSGLVLVGRQSSIAGHRVAKVFYKQRPLEVLGVQLVLKHPENTPNISSK
jgi:hypothetical protein